MTENQTFWKLIFGLLLALCGILFFVFLRGEAGDYHGIAHPTSQDMLIGGDGSQRLDGGLLWLGGIYGVLQLMLFVALLLPGLKKSASSANLLFYLGGFAYVAAFVAVMWTYASELKTVGGEAGLPLSTWIALFVFWPIPYLFVATYSFGYKRLVYAK